jgi:glycosyltransferase involved in cell wall biosynthesis
MISILLYSFIVVVGVQIFYYSYVFGKFSFAKPNESKVKRIGISIIVCAKNEEENVRNLIPKLLEQDYPEFEIVLIDDASSDSTLDIFEEFEKLSDKIKLVKVQNNETFWGNKKFALTLGIKAAKFDYLLFTDADCLPNTINWVKEISSNFTSQKTIVLGYGGYEKIKNSFLNKMIRFDTTLIAIQYFSWAKLGKPYMGIGRNLAYHKSEFFQNNGFINHMKIKSGDDDLFINEIANKKNTAICYNSESFTISKSKLKFKDWKIQKRRHISTSKLYKKRDKIQLGIYFISQLLFFLLLIINLILKNQIEIILIGLSLRYISSYIAIVKSSVKLNEKDLILYYPILEIGLILFQLNVYFTNLPHKTPSWK